MSATLASKLLMCVCAGTIGAVSVPIANKVRHRLHRPAAHRVVKAPPAPCDPVAVSAGGLATAPLGFGQIPTLEAAQLAIAGDDRVTAPGRPGTAIRPPPAGGLYGGGPSFGPPVFPGWSAAPGDEPFRPGPVLPPVVEPPQSPPSAVPEIAAWLMMILGIGGVGAAARRVRKMERGL